MTRDEAPRDSVFATAAKLLIFRADPRVLRRLDARHFAFGIICTWLAGIGRYWDNPLAQTWQYLGFGSVAYVFVLSAVLWTIIASVRPRHFSYWNVLVFVTLTSPPALLYAIPVERFLSEADARSANMWFLIVVAAWRVALYAYYVRKVAVLPPVRAWAATLVPLVGIVVALASLNLEHAVFDFMAGYDVEATPNDGAYALVLGLSLLSLLAAIPLFILYQVALVQAWSHRQNMDPRDRGAPSSPAPSNEEGGEPNVVRPPIEAARDGDDSGRHGQAE